MRVPTLQIFTLQEISMPFVCCMHTRRQLQCNDASFLNGGRWSSAEQIFLLHLAGLAQDLHGFDDLLLEGHVVFEVLNQLGVVHFEQHTRDLALCIENQDQRRKAGPHKSINGTRKKKKSKPNKKQKNERTAMPGCNTSMRG